MVDESAAGPLLYRNELRCSADVASFRMEGPGAISFPLGRLRLESTADPGEGQAANLVFWCDEKFGPDIVISWDFWPVRQPGLCITFFSAAGCDGEDLFDPSLAPRNGPYQQCHSGDINAYHISYFRRPNPEQRRLQVCNLRKSAGFHLVAQGADPLPSVAEAEGPYRMQIVMINSRIEFSIDGLRCLSWRDDGSTAGPPLTGGHLGFRQMAPLIAEYANLTVHRAAH